LAIDKRKNLMLLSVIEGMLNGKPEEEAQKEAKEEAN
jgi:hypothetical protein